MTPSEFQRAMDEVEAAGGEKPTHCTMNPNDWDNLVTLFWRRAPAQKESWWIESEYEDGDGGHHEKRMNGLTVTTDPVVPRGNVYFYVHDPAETEPRSVNWVTRLLNEQIYYGEAFSSREEIEARMTDRERLEELVGGHYSCEDDPWYSCPLSENGSANEALGNVCICDLDGRVARLEAFRDETWESALASRGRICPTCGKMDEYEKD